MHIRKLIITTLVAVMAIPMAAQPEAGTISIVPRIGVDIANVSGDHSYQYNTVGTYTLEGKYRPDFTGGLEVMYQYNPQIAFSLGVMYALEGCRYEDREIGTGTTRVGFNENKVGLQYVQVPVMVHYYIAKGFSVNAGVRVGFLTSANHEYNATDITYHELSNTRDYGTMTSYDEATKDLCKKTSVSIPIGVSYEYMNVVLDARYHFPLTKVWDNENDGKVKSFTVTVGYKFNL